MSLPFTIRMPVAILILVLIVTTALVAFWLSKPSTNEISWEKREQSWQQIGLSFKPFSPSSLDIISNHRLWGLVDSKTGESNPVTWSVNGIISENGVRSFIATIAQEKDGRTQNEIKRYSLDDTMPNGEIVIKINKDSVVYEIDGKKLEKHLYEFNNSKGEKGL